MSLVEGGSHKHGVDARMVLLICLEVHGFTKTLKALGIEDCAATRITLPGNPWASTTS